MTGRGTRPREAQPSYPGIRFPPRHPRAAAVTPSRARPSGSLLLALADQGRFLHSVDGDVHGGASSPHTEQSFPLRSLVQLLQECWTRLHAHQCSLSPPLTFFFFKSQKGFLKLFPGGFETAWRQSPSQERRPSQASERGMKIAPTAPLPPSASASSSLQKGVRGGGKNPVIPQPPRPRPRQETSHFTEESSEESWLGVRLELSLSPLSGSYLK